jgi:ATP-dependent exoDNAse (exonuclease V) beta subunit
LQSPIVIFADEDNKPTLRQEDFLFDESLFLLRPSEKQSNVFAKKLKELHLDKMEQEDRRLLYVMMTRSQDELYIARQETSNTKSWSSLIENALSNLDSKKSDGFTIYEKKYFDHDVIDRNTLSIDKKDNLDYPTLFNRSISLNADNFNKIISSASDQNIESLKFGTLIHELLEILSYTPQENWITLISSYEKKYNLSKAYSEKILHLISSKKFELFFKQPCLSEINVVYEGKFKGRIDRISIHEPYIYLLDFKTGAKNKHFYKSYLEQLEFYTKFLQQSYPNFIVIKHILWIDDLNLEVVSDNPTKKSY